MIVLLAVCLTAFVVLISLPRSRERPGTPRNESSRMLRHKPVFLCLAALALTASCSDDEEASGPPAAAPTSTGSAPADGAWSLVAIGDSLPYARQDCGGCASFATLFAAEITSPMGAPTTVENLSTHDGATTVDLLERVKTNASIREALGAADVVVISAGHNDTPWNLNDDACDGPSGDDIDWSRFNSACASEEAKEFGVTLDGVLSEVDELRAGKPTAVRLINFYNDWIGGPGVPPEATAGSKLVLDAFSTVICDIAAAHDARCVDTYHAFNGPDGLQAAGTLLAQDYTHPSATGHERIAELLTAAGLTPLQ